MNKIILFVLLFISAPIIFASTIAVEVKPNYQVVYLNRGLNQHTGGVNQSAYEYIDRFVIELKSDREIILQINDSSGGYSVYFFYLIEVLAKTNSQISIVVNGRCASACTFILPMANKTYAVKSKAVLKTHRSFIELDGTNWVSSKESQAKKYGEYGANEGWFLNNQYVFRDDNTMSTLNENDALNSGLVDKFIDSLDEAFPEELID